MNFKITGLVHRKAGAAISYVHQICTLSWTNCVAPDGPAPMLFAGFIVHCGSSEIGWVPKGQTQDVLDYIKANKQKTKRRNEGEFEIRILSTCRQDNGYQGLVFQFQDIVDSNSVPAHDFTESSVPPSVTYVELKDQTMKVPPLSQVLSSNIHAAGQAAKLEVGHVANEQLGKIMAKRIPSKYADLMTTPLGHLLLANAVQYAGKAFYADNKQLADISMAMTINAYQEVLALVDIPGIIDELLSNKKLKAALDSDTKAE